MTPSPFIPGFELILASQSPRRAELLTQAGIPFKVRASSFPEILEQHEPPRDYVSRLASGKAAAVVRQSHEAVLAADTTVVVNNRERSILEKPRDAADAKDMLKSLSGTSHSVLTAVCLLYGGKEWLHVEETIVHFAPLSISEINRYVASKEPFDKAGAYGIQGLASKFVTKIEGCYFNVVGLPVHQVYRILHLSGALARDESL